MTDASEPRRVTAQPWPLLSEAGALLTHLQASAMRPQKPFAWVFTRTPFNQEAQWGLHLRWHLTKLAQDIGLEIVEVPYDSAAEREWRALNGEQPEWTVYGIQAGAVIDPDTPQQLTWALRKSVDVLRYQFDSKQPSRAATP